MDKLSDHPNQIEKSPYAYGWNNPVNLTDPDGNCPICIIIGIGELIADLTVAEVVTTAAVATAAVMVVNNARNHPMNLTFNSVQDNTRREIDYIKADDNQEKSAKQLLKEGRAGKPGKLAELMADPKSGKADRGWLKQEKNAVDDGKRSNMRNPPGKELAHERGREAAKGYSYKHSKLQNKADHKTQHKYDNNGKKNKERPVK